MSTILDGAALTALSPAGRLDPRAYLLSLYPQAPIPPLDHVVLTAPPLVARVNHGLWIASCPCGARGVPTPGGVVWLDQPLLWCLRCQNGGTGRGWRPVTVPPEGERQRIEAVLLCRPNVADRNWEPHESVADLIAQNREHGDPVPDLGESPAATPSPVPTGPRWPSDAALAALRALRSRSRLGRLVGG